MPDSELPEMTLPAPRAAPPMMFWPAEMKNPLPLGKAALPPGYRIETAGAVEEADKGAASINRVMPLMLLTMLGLLMVQLQSFTRTLMVVATAPLGAAGAGLLGEHFGVRSGLGFVAAGAILLTLGTLTFTRLRHVKE